ncbi:zinc finger BED domain-containing protein RICESLEEPER 2 [Tanacetum coccineum]
MRRRSDRAMSSNSAQDSSAFLSITMEEYIRLEEERLRDKDDSFTNLETEYPAIVFDDTSDAALSWEPTVSPLDNNEIDFNISFDDSTMEDLHDILCIQVSTVASESAFSASGRVLDPYRNSLAPNIVEALVCTQDWIRTSSRNITMDTLEDLMKDDELAKEIQEGLDKQKGEQGQGREKNVQA